MMETNDQDHAKWVERKWAAFNEIAAFYEHIDRLVMPCMRMHTKAPWF
jgi:hypothetical protein